MIRPTTAVLGIALISASAVPLAQDQRALTTADYDPADVPAPRRYEQILAAYS